jgi:hypothetical protein
MVRAQRVRSTPGVQVRLGRLESTDWAPLSAQRKEAVNAFWAAYLGADEKPVEIEVDGANVLADAESR